MDTIKKRVIAFFVGLFIAIFLLEIGLRIVGSIHLKRVTSDKRTLTSDRDNLYTILCLGDSFTFGVGASQRKDYPNQLEGLLNSKVKGRVVSVVNRGKGANNTANVLDALYSHIDTIKPDLIILLIGAANSWNYWGYQRYLKGKTLLSLLYDQLYRIRIYKLIKLLFLNIRSKDSLSVKKLKDRLLKSNNEALESMHPAYFSAYFSTGCRCKSRGNYEEAIRWFNEGIKVDPRDGFNYFGVGESYEAQEKYKEAMEWFKEGIKADPGNNFNYCGITRVCRKTGGTYAEIIKFLRKTAKNNPVALNFIEVLKKENIDMETNQWIKSDIEKIIKICRENKIEIILQNYPYGGGGTAGKILKNIAKNQSIPFVDNYQAFNKLLNKGGKREDYFMSDDHCSDKGYRVMAENIYDKIIEEKILDWNDGE